MKARPRMWARKVDCRRTPTARKSFSGQVSGGAGGAATSDHYSLAGCGGELVGYWASERGDHFRVWCSGHQHGAMGLRADLSAYSDLDGPIFDHDRRLVAQALSEKMVLVTADEKLLPRDVEELLA